jgi:predicted nucleic acid-binding protein
MSTLLDSNVLIDVVDTSSPWHLWSSQHLLSAAEHGVVLINQVILAETAELFLEPREFETYAVLSGLSRESVPWEACYEAGRAHVEYRRSGGQRERTLPDFLVGAHAKVRAYTLLTRDPRRYRQYFPTLEIIAPDTHP